MKKRLAKIYYIGVAIRQNRLIGAVLDCKRIAAAVTAISVTWYCRKPLDSKEKSLKPISWGIS